MAEVPTAKTAHETLIQIVDDDVGLRDAIAAVLADEGYRVAAMGPAGAVEAAVADPPDLILLDVLMPGADGRHLCRRLRSARATRATPIVFVSGVPEFALDPFRDHGGAWGYLRKPFGLDELIDTVARHLAAPLATGDDDTPPLPPAVRDIHTHLDAIEAAARNLGSAISGQDLAVRATIVEGVDLVRQALATLAEPATSGIAGRERVG
ncbi:MAG TPA: response regulator [Thermomicrobiales bacterium]|jgi:CheY-like chemotaxis protein